MNTLMKRYIILVFIAAFCWGSIYAQEDNLPSRSLTIEGEYNPSVTEAGKIMPAPEKQRTERQPSSVSYNTAANPYQGLERNPMLTFGSKSDSVTAARHSGLVRFGYGMRNLHDGLLDLDWNITERDKLKVSGLFNAWASDPTGKWKSRMSDGDLNLDYRHRFDGVVLGVDASYGHSHYNFMPGVAMDSAKLEDSNLMLKTNRWKLGLSLSGRNNDVKWYAKAGLEGLSRGSLKLDGAGIDNNESLLRVSAGLELPVAGGTGGVDYKQKTASYDWTGLEGAVYSDFTTITLSPYWKYQWGDLDTRLGLNVDVRTGAGHAFLLSPMATAVYPVSEKLKLDAGVTGGLVEYDMRTLAQISPYWSETERIKDGYNLMNLYVGASFYQGSWLTASAKAGYKLMLDEAFQSVADSLIVTSVLNQEASNILYVRMDADMQFTDKAQICLEATYSKYLGKYNGYNLALKPVLDASIYGRVNIVKGLDAMLTYRLMLFGKIEGYRMPAVNDLAFTVDYDFTDRLSFYATLKHLAGGDFYYYAGYRALQPAFMLGASYRF